MSDFDDSSKIYGLIRKYEQLFIGLVLGFTIFLGISLSAINVILFLVLGTFIISLLTYITIYEKKSKESLARGRPKGSKNKPKEVKI
jgi:hypothetical protein